MLTENQTRLQATLDALRSNGEVRGALLISRDGFCMMNQYDALPGADTFSAMSATLMGAAEAALAELGDHAPLRVVVETRHGRLVATGVTKEILLVAIADVSAALDPLVKRVERAAEDVARILGT